MGHLDLYDILRVPITPVLEYLVTEAELLGRRLRPISMFTSQCAYAYDTYDIFIYVIHTVRIYPTTILPIKHAFVWCSSARSITCPPPVQFTYNIYGPIGFLLLIFICYSNLFAHENNSWYYM